MSDNKQNKTARLTNRISIGNKMIMAVAFWVAGFVLMAAASWWYTLLVRDEYRKESENSVVLSSQQLFEITVGSGVSIARNIYANPNLYDFLDREYTSSADYYEAYYAILQNSPTAIAESNAVKKYTIYTSNPTVSIGGNIASLSSEENSGWLTAYKRLGRAMILYCSPDKEEVSLIRRLDFTEMKNGEGYLKIDLNLTQLKASIDSLEFEGQVYIVSGAGIVYSSTPGVDIDDIYITQDFCATKKNYYTADIEFYSLADRNAYHIGFEKTVPYFIAGAVLGLMLMLILMSISISIKRRCAKAEKLLEEESTLISFRGKNYGRDEISRLIDIGVSLSERLIHRSDEAQRSSESLMEKSGDYTALFGIAMRMDAQLYVQANFPDIAPDFHEENTLEEEMRLLERTVSRHDASVTLPKEIPQITVHGMVLALAAESLCSHAGEKKVSADIKNGVMNIRYTCSKQFPKTTLLRLEAIFEDSRISEEYDFSKGSSFNPFLRLKYCFGDSASITASSSAEGTDITIKIILT